MFVVRHTYLSHEDTSVLGTQLTLAKAWKPLSVKCEQPAASSCFKPRHEAPSFFSVMSVRDSQPEKFNLCRCGQFSHTGRIPSSVMVCVVRMCVCVCVCVYVRVCKMEYSLHHQLHCRYVHVHVEDVYKSYPRKNEDTLFNQDIFSCLKPVCNREVPLHCTGSLKILFRTYKCTYKYNVVTSDKSTSFLA